MFVQSHLRNRLLSRLPPRDFARIATHLEAGRTGNGAVLVSPDAPIAQLHFPESGTASIIARSPEGQQAEIGLIGREGFVHPAVMLGADRIPQMVMIQLPGDSLHLPRRHLLAAAEDSAELRRLLLLFAQAQAVQTSFTTLSNAVHQTDERLARWLLMCHDRSESDDLALTHEFMGLMLSVRRPSVTNALHVLEGNRLIRLERGFVCIRDRAALERYAGDAYGRPEAEYHRLFGPL